MIKTKPTLQRLPIYLRILKRMDEEGIEFVSSTMIAEELDYNSVKVRKDLAFVSKDDGKSGVGFNVKQLIRDIEDSLHLNEKEKIIVVGTGNIGQALMHYDHFESSVEIVMGFARNEDKCDDIKIKHISKLKDYIKENNIRIAILTVSKESAQEVCDMLVDAGIEGIWNFAPVILKAPKNVKIKNEDLDSSLAVLLKQVL